MKKISFYIMLSFCACISCTVTRDIYTPIDVINREFPDNRFIRETESDRFVYIVMDKDSCIWLIESGYGVNPNILSKEVIECNNCFDKVITDDKKSNSLKIGLFTIFMIALITFEIGNSL